MGADRMRPTTVFWHRLVADVNREDPSRAEAEAVIIMIGLWSFKPRRAGRAEIMLGESFFRLSARPKIKEIALAAI
jgi:hypothetical protein